MSSSTPASRASAVADVLNGADTAHVAKDHDVQAATVDRWVREHDETGEALDAWAREQHQEVREQREAKPVADELAQLSAAETAALLGITVDEDGSIPGDAPVESPAEHDLRDTFVGDDAYATVKFPAEHDPGDDGILTQAAQARIDTAEDEAETAALFGDAYDDFEDYDDWEANGDTPADSSVPFLARDANDPYPSSYGSLSATVNDPNY